MEPFEQAPLVAYILALTLTPGPSSMLIAAAGARFGLARCTPHLAGSLSGWVLQLAAAAQGLGAALVGDPWTHGAMQCASTAYLLWLGARMLRARPDRGAPAAAPLAWQAAAALQLANPKSWMTATASAGLFLPAAATWAQQGAFLVSAGAAGVGGLAMWAAAGAVLQRWLRHPAHHARFHRVMAAALAVTALWGFVMRLA